MSAWVFGAEGFGLSTAPSSSAQPVWTAMMITMTVLYVLIVVVLTSYTAYYTFSWLFWSLCSMLLTLMSLSYALYQLFRINLDLGLMSLLKFFNFFTCKSRRGWRSAGPYGGGSVVGGGSSNWAEWEQSQRPKRSTSLAEYEGDSGSSCKEARFTFPLGVGSGGRALAASVEAWRHDSMDLPQAALLRKTTDRLRAAREGGRLQDLQFLLGGLLKRNHLGIHDEELHPPYDGAGWYCGAAGGDRNSSSCNDDNGYGGGTTKVVVEAFQGEVEACLDVLVETEDLSLDEKLAFFKKERRSLGQSALCLSGGGSICMYHLGTLKALIEAGIYRHLRVVSGTSGGSIIAAMVACKTEADLMTSVIVPWISTDFRRDGRQAARKIQWFPPLRKQLVNFLQYRVLVDSKDFKECCTYYYGDMTFAEAFARTKRHVSITVTMSSDSVLVRERRVLLNHISSPHVTLASAVASSCALPGIMLPTSLEAKDPSDGRLHKASASHGQRSLFFPAFHWFLLSGVEGAGGFNLTALFVLIALHGISNQVSYVCLLFPLLYSLKSTARRSLMAHWWRIYLSSEWPRCSTFRTSSFPR
jgi:hypothetical protein